jgi:hypothetical protein
MEGTGGWLYRLAGCGWREIGNWYLQTVSVSKVKARVPGTRKREQAFGAPEDKIDRTKGVLEGGRRGETKGQGSGYLNQDCSMGMRTRYDLKWIIENGRLDHG